jgi:hypothetical protein
LGTWNIAAHGILKVLGGGDPVRFRSFSARFSKCVYPREALQTRMWKIGIKGGFELVVFQTAQYDAVWDFGKRKLLMLQIQVQNTKH